MPANWTRDRARIYPADDRPDVEVLVDGEWYPGELRAWYPRVDGWWGNVSYRTGVSEQATR
jgi:hypothetical protein